AWAYDKGGRPDGRGARLYPDAEERRRQRQEDLGERSEGCFGEVAVHDGLTTPPERSPGKEIDRHASSSSRNVRHEEPKRHAFRKLPDHRRPGFADLKIAARSG